MSFESPLAWVPSLADVIERNPITVAPTTPLGEAIVLVSQRHHPICWVADPPEAIASESSPAPIRASCVLVVEARRILGILTERDVVRLAAQVADVWLTPVSEVMVQPVITLPERSVQDIFAALFLFRRYRIRHVPVVDDQNHLLGVISHESVRQVLRPANLLRFRRVADVMTTNVIQAPLHSSVLYLAQLMAHHRVSCVVITQRDTEDVDQPVGIVTERDIVQFQALRMNLGQTFAQAVMSSPLFLLSPNDSLWVAHQEMQKRRVGRLVVSWNWGQGLGIVTQTSLLRVFDPMEMYGVIENLQKTLEQLRSPALNSRQASPTPASVEAPLPLPNTLMASLTPLQVMQEAHLAQLDTIVGQIQQLIDRSDFPPEEQQSRLQSLLTHLQQLRQSIAAPPS